MISLNAPVYSGGPVAHDSASDIKRAQEVQRLRDENIRLRAELRGVHRGENVVLRVIEQVEDLLPALKAVKPGKPPRQPADTVEEDMLLLFSDQHADEDVKPEQVGHFEDFNFDIACRRVETLSDRIREFKAGMRGKTHSKLHILSLGDSIGGDCHDQQRYASFPNYLQSSLAVAQMFSLFYREMAGLFQDVEVVSLTGNHPRLRPHKPLHDSTENLDYLIAKIAEISCVNQTNLRFTTPDTYMHRLEIMGRGYIAIHGDGIRGGGAVNGAKKVARVAESIHGKEGRDVTALLMGHFHDPATNFGGGVEIFSNGSLRGTDSYCYNGSFDNREPSQLLLGITGDGPTWRNPIKVKTHGEKNREPRYQIPVAL